MGGRNGKKCPKQSQTQTNECAKNLNVYHFQRACPPAPVPAPCGGYGGFAPAPCGDFGGFGGAYGGFPAVGPVPVGCGGAGFDPSVGYGLPGPGPVGYGGFPCGQAGYAPY